MIYKCEELRELLCIGYLDRVIKVVWNMNVC